MAGAVTNRKDQVVEALVVEHFANEPDLEQDIWLCGDEPQDEIRLLHLDNGTIPTGDVQSFRFAPTPEVPYAVRLAQVTPDEWDRVQNHEVALPPSWSLKDRRTYARRNGRD